MIETFVTEVAENIYRIKLPMPFGLDHIHVYLLKEPGSLALVDCGLDLPESWQRLDEGLAQLGLTPADLTDIFVTHAHPDHIGQLDRLRRLAPAARLFIHHREYFSLKERLTDPASVEQRMVGWLRRNGLDRGSGESLASVGIKTAPQIQASDRLLSGGEFFRFDKPAASSPFASEAAPGGWQIFWTPGHTAGHFVLFNQDRRLLLSGDHLLGSISSNVGKYPGSTDDPLGDFINSLQEIQRLEIKEVLPAHGPTFTNYRERVDDLIAHHRVRLEKIHAALESEPQTAAQVVETIWGERARGFHRFLALGEALSHLERLRREGQVILEQTHTTDLYRVT